MTAANLVLAAQLKQLLCDATAYSALVPWVLDAQHKGLTLSQYAQERQCLQDLQLQVGHARPQDMQQCVLQLVAEVCRQAQCLSSDACQQPCAAAALQQDSGVNDLQQGCHRREQHPAQQPTARSAGSGSSSPCSLSQPAARLAKLHGHLLSHLAAPHLAEQLQQLLLLLVAGPLDSAPAAGSKQASSSKPAAGRQVSRSLLASSSPAASLPAAATATDSLEQLLPCRACGARYAAKALECCGKLLACMPTELQQALVCSPHLQQYGPALATLLSKSLAAGAAACAQAGVAVGSQPGTTTPWRQQQQQQGQAGGSDCTPASAGAASAGRPAVLGWAATATPGSGGSAGGGASWLTADGHPGSSGGKAGGRGSSRAPAAARLSGLGLLMPSTPGTGVPGRPASAGQLPSGGKAAKTAAVCNREKSRDMFFTILRKASSRLDALRQAQEQAAAGAAAGGYGQQATAAEAAAAAEMAEVLAEVGLAAKQLLLQLAPSNLGYLAELFMACVLQAASTGEPLLEPALVLIAEKDPSRFQKLQQRLADRPAGTAGSASPVAARSQLATTSNRNSSSKQTAEAAARASQQQLQSGKHGSQQASLLQPRSAASDLQAAGATAGRADGLVHVLHVRSRNRPKQQQQPHILATAGGSGRQPSQGVAVGSAGSSGGVALKRLVPQRQVTSHANSCTPFGQQPQQQAQHSSAGQHATSGLSAGAAGSGFMGGVSPMPLGAVGAADSPLPAHCLSPLFAAASQSPLALTELPGSLPGKAAAAGSPLVNCSSTVRPGSPAAAAAVPSSKLQQGSEVVQALPPHSGLAAAPAASRTPAAAAVGAASAHKVSTATAKGSRVVAASTASGPHSAPPKLQAVALGSSTPGPGSAAVLAQHGIGPAHVMLQLMQYMPAGQHVLLLLLHAADSSSFNRAVLAVMCGRVELLLSSSPGSFTAASGLGQQASAIVALGSFCSYLSFAAGTAEPEAGAASLQPDSTPRPALQGSQAPATLLQQQPGLDVATTLQRLLAWPAASSSMEAQQPAGGSASALDAVWRIALAVPFAVSSVRLAGLNPAAAASPCVQAALGMLRALRRLPALSPTSPGFGTLPICLSCCVQSCAPTAGAGAEPGPASGPSLEGHQAEELSKVLASGSCLVDGSYWSICCPGLQQLIAVLQASTAEAAAAAGSSSAVPGGLSTRGQLRVDKPSGVRAQQQDAAAADSAAAGEHAGAGRTGAASGTVRTGLAADSQAPQAAGASAPPGDKSHGSSSGSSPAGSAAVRHTTPLLLAPRGPAEVAAPAVMLEALAAVSDPVRQQLQQAFIGQYSTDDNPVKMRDVLTVINGILLANSLSRALSQGLPGVLQKHLDLLQRAVQQQLAPAAPGAEGGSSTQLQGQDLARAVHALYTQQLALALPEALEAAMQAASDHACHAAATACGALLPSDVPPAAEATAAALVTASCKAGCAQRLLTEVPVLVQSTLADATDDLVRLVNRQWAVHSRMTAAAAGAAAALDSSIPRTDSISSIKSGSTSTSSKPPVRVQPVKVEEGPTRPASTPDAVGAAPVQQEPLLDVQVQPAGSAAAGAGQGRGTGHLYAVPAAAGSVGQGAALSAHGSPSTGRVDMAGQPAAQRTVKLDAPAVAASIAPSAGGAGAPAAGPAADRRNTAAEGSAASLIQAYLVAAHQLGGGPSQQQTSGQQVTWTPGLTAAAEDAAQQLMAGVTGGRFAMQEVEQQLLGAIQLAHAAARSSQAGAADEQALQQAAQAQLLVLLAGALMHALLCCPGVKADVWGGCSAGAAAGAAAGGEVPGAALPPHLTQLPVLLMKAARADAPVWLLRQLRQWMQAATLGCH